MSATSAAIPFEQSMTTGTSPEVFSHIIHKKNCQPVLRSTAKEKEHGKATDWQSSTQVFDEGFGEPRERTSARYLSLGRHSLTREPVTSVTKLKPILNKIL